MSRPAKAVARAALVAMAALVVIVLAVGFGVDLPGTDEHIPDALPIPRALLLLCLVGIAVAACGLTIAAGASGWLPGRLVLAGLAFIGMTMGSGLREVGHLVGNHTLLVRGGWAIVLASLPLAFAPRRLIRSRPLVALVLALAPYVTVLVIYIAAGTASYRVSPEFIAAGNAGWGDEVSLHGLVVKGGLVIYGVSIGGYVLLLTWQVVEAARASRDAAVGWFAAGSVAKRALVLFVAAKLVFLAIGYAGLMPAGLVARRVFADSAHDGVLSWALGVALGGVVVVGVLVEKWRHWERHALIPLVFVVTGAMLAVVGDAVLLAGAYAARLVTGAANVVLARVRDWWFDTGLWFTVLPTYVSVASGVWLIRRQGKQALGAGLLLFGVWGLPRAITISHDLLSHPASAYRSPTHALDLLEVAEQYPGWVNAATLDAIISLAVAGMTIALVRGYRRVVSAEILGFVLLLSTITAHATSFLPSDWKDGRFFYVALVFPVIYAFLADAAPLNRPDHRRQARVVAATAVGVWVLASAALQIANANTQPGQPDYADVGRSLFTVPLVILLGAVALSTARARRLGDAT